MTHILASEQLLINNMFHTEQIIVNHFLAVNLHDWKAAGLVLISSISWCFFDTHVPLSKSKAVSTNNTPSTYIWMSFRFASTLRYLALTISMGCYVH